MAYDMLIGDSPVPGWSAPQRQDLLVGKGVVAGSAPPKAFLAALGE